MGLVTSGKDITQHLQTRKTPFTGHVSIQNHAGGLSGDGIVKIASTVLTDCLDSVGFARGSDGVVAIAMTNA